MKVRVCISILLFLGVLLGEGLVKGDTCPCVYNPFVFNTSIALATISGRIVDQNTQQPLPGSYATCTKATRTFGPTFAQNGTFKYSNATPGWYTCVGDHINYLKNSVTVYATNNSTIVIPLTPKNGAIIGTVYNAITYETYGNALVNCTQTTGKYITPNFVTKADGRFFFTDILPGYWSCVGYVPGFAVAGQIKEVLAGEHRVYDLLLYPLPGSIAGYVLTEGSSSPISGAGVTCTSDEASAAGATGTSFSTLSGYYDIGSFYAGRASCVVSASGFNSQRKSGVVFTGAVTIINFTLPQSPSSLVGNVSDSVSGGPVAASVSCTSGAAAATASANVAGSYSINPISTGFWTCTASATGYASRTSFIRVPASTQANLPFILDPLPSAVIGTVFVKNGATLSTVADASVTCNFGTFSRSQSSNTTGDYTFDNILVSSASSPLSFQCAANKTGYASGSKSSTLGRGQVVRVDLELVMLSLTVTVLDNATRLPISEASVVCTGSSVYEGPSRSPNGSIVFSGATPGTYNCSATKDGYSGDSRSGIVVDIGNPSGVAVLYLSVPRWQVHGFVYVFQYPDITTENAVVTVSSSDGTQLGQVRTTNTSGYFSIMVPLPGRFRFTASNGVNFLDGNSVLAITLANYTTPVRVPVLVTSSAIEGYINDESGKPISGVTVFGIAATGLVAGNYTTGSNGYYYIGRLGVGAFTIRGVLNGYESSNVAVTVARLGLVVRQDVTLAVLRYGGVAGFVYTSSLAVKTALANATVVVRNEDNGQTVTLTTDAAGRYSTNRVDPGRSISVTASKQGFVTSTFTGIVVSLGSITNILDFTLSQKAGTVSGVITARGADGRVQLASQLFPVVACAYPENHPLPVTSCQESGLGSVADSERSSYTITNIPEGVWTIYAFSTSTFLVPTSQRGVRVLEEAPQTVNFEMALLAK